MNWESWGFEDTPFKTQPITNNSLPLFVGHEKETKLCLSCIKNKEVLIVVEGGRGIGTTSFSNYVRFNAQNEKLYITPEREIRIEPQWSLETLLAAIISNIIGELELRHKDKVKNDKRFVEAKTVSNRVSDIYRSFGISVLGVGGNYGETLASTHPSLIPSPTLGKHLEALGKLSIELGYKNGVLIQLNNLDVGIVQDEKSLKQLLNLLRDYVHTPNTTWLLVGDIGIRSFIARNVDRLDDIVSFEVFLKPLDKAYFKKLVAKRIEYFRNSDNAVIPFDENVLEYIYEISKGRLRYIFGLLNRMVTYIHVGDLIDNISLDIAKPVVKQMARERVKQDGISDVEEEVLKCLVKLESSTVTGLTKETKKSQPYISKTLSTLLKMKQVYFTSKGASRIYSPSLDAKIAYGNKEKQRLYE